MKILWETSPRNPDSNWHILQAATLTVDPANYWPGFEMADSTCPNGIVGFRLVVDSVTNEVLYYDPGI